MTDSENEKPTRSEYRVTADDTLASLLERIREAQGTELLLDITENNLLLKDGSLRRTLVSAASEFEKKVTFSFSEKQNLRHSERVEENKKPVLKVSCLEHEREGVARAVPVAVVKQVKEMRPVFRDLPKIKLGDSGKRIAVFFSFFAGILLAGGIFFILPRADIKITPEVEPISMNLALTATVSALNVDAEKGIVPAQILNYEEVVSGAFPVKGVLQQGEKAHGQVTIVNRTVTEQKIKGKSRLKGAGDIMFTMDESVTVAPHSSVAVKITADQGGTVGNLQSGKLYFVALPDTDQAILYAEVVAPLMGGTDKTVPALSKDDFENAKKQFLAEKQDKLKKTLEDSLAPDVVRDDRFLQFDLSDLSAVESIGAQIADFHLKGKAKSKYFVFKQNDVTELVNRTVGKRVTEGKVLSKKLDALDLTINKIDWKENTVSFNYSVQNSVQNKFDLEVIKKDLVARTLDGAQTYLRGIAGIKDVSVKLSPFWVKRVPGFKKNIRIEIEVP